jgi:hypothetical protein
VRKSSAFAKLIEQNVVPGALMSKRMVAILAMLASVLFAYQNCSNVGFSTIQKSSVNPDSVDPTDPTVTPECRELSAPEVAPRLLWDWYKMLPLSNAPRFENFDQVMASTVVADLDGDKFSEVLFMTFTRTQSEWFNDSLNTALHHRNGVLRVVDGRSGITKWSVGNKELAPFGDIVPRDSRQCC